MNITDERTIEFLLTAPSQRLLEDLIAIDGDFMILGGGGKMGPSLAALLRNALRTVGSAQKVYSASRFSDSRVRLYLEQHGVTTFSGDLLDQRFLAQLPDVVNVLYLAGQKFGTAADQAQTWAMNAFLPGLVATRYAGARLVVFSTGNVYPLTPIAMGGATESTPPQPIGEYAQSCLARERVFEYFGRRSESPVLLFRLNYALDLRYGVLNDIARAIWEGRPVDLTMGYVNVIWQGDANEYAIRSFRHSAVPAAILNIAGTPHAVRDLALDFARLLDREPQFIGQPAETALLSNAQKAYDLMGPPVVNTTQMCDWTATWIAGGGADLGKPTHFQEREGNF